MSFRPVPESARHDGRPSPRPAALPEASEPFPISELSPRGLLWLINRVVFHPRGFALAVVGAQTDDPGFQLLGDGTEPIYFERDEDALFGAVEGTFADARKHARPS